MLNRCSTTEPQALQRYAMAVSYSMPWNIRFRMQEYNQLEVLIVPQRTRCWYLSARFLCNPDFPVTEIRGNKLKAVCVCGGEELLRLLLK